MQLTKITRNGNSAHVAMPKPFLRHLNWLPGESVLVVLNEDQTLTLIRIKPEELLARHREQPRQVDLLEAQP